jgi:hypothetical protein
MKQKIYIRYKLTDKKMQTFGDTKWSIGETKTIDQTLYTDEMRNELCNKAWLHCYSNPLLAILLNPTHGYIKNPKLFKCEVFGNTLNERGLKEGWNNITLIEELCIPIITIEQKTAFSLLCSLKVYKEKTYVKWAKNWLSNKDRSAFSANNILDSPSINTATHAAAAAANAIAAAVAANAITTANTALHATYAAKKLNLIKIIEKAMLIY